MGDIHIFFSFMQIGAVKSILWLGGLSKLIFVLPTCIVRFR